MMREANIAVKNMQGFRKLTRSRWMCSLLTLLMMQPWTLMGVAYAAYVDETVTRLPVDNDNSYSFDSADIDGVNGPDVLVANRGQSRLLMNDGAGVFSDETATRLPLSLHTTLAVAFGDVDGVNGVDAMLVGDGQNRLLINNGSGEFSDATATHMPVALRTSLDVALADVDGDGDLDAVIANRGASNRLLLNNGSGVFNEAPAGRLATDSALSYGVALGDANGDGSPDIFFANFAAQNTLHINNNLGTFSDATANLPAVITGSGDAVFFDADADGDNDIAIAEGGQGVGLLINDGSGTYGNAPAGALPVINAFIVKIAAGDVDFDGLPDLIAGAMGQDLVLFNDGLLGPGSFSDVTAAQMPIDDQRSFGLAMLDADTDLDLDLLLATPQGQNRFYDNAIAAPRTLIGISPDYIEVTDTVTIDVSVFDEDGVDTIVVEVIPPTAPTVTLSGTSPYSFVPGEIGVHTVRVTATDSTIPGNVSVKEASFLAQANDTTDPTVSVTAVPNTITQGETVSFTVTASDDRGVVSTGLTVGGVAVPLDSSGQAIYAPTAIGTLAVVASASDAAANVGTDTVTLQVDPDSEPPIVTLGAGPDPIDITNPIAITATATDNIALNSFSVTVNGPAGGPVDEPVVLNGAGIGSFTPFIPGTYTFTATAIDPAGNTTVQTASVEAVGIPDTEDPVVDLLVVPGITISGGTVTLTVNATDNIFVLNRTLTINGSPITLDGSFQAQFTTPGLGDYTAIATATDPTGNIGTRTVVFSAVDPATDTSAPDVDITDPAQGSDISGLTTFAGTATDLTLVSYELAYKRTGSSDPFVDFHTSNQIVENGPLGTLDTTVLENGLYDIRLTATDINGLSSSIVRVFNADGGFKPGIFSISFIDLQVPVAGIPIKIKRSYDSRRRNISDDFGNGWKLEVLKDGTYINNRPPGEGWSISSGGPFGIYNCGSASSGLDHFTEIRFSDSEFYLFRPQINLIQTIASICPGTVSYTQIGGVPGASLVPSGSNEIDCPAGGGDCFVNANPFDTYNPENVVLTTLDGREYQISLSAGVTRIEDSNGNSLSINNNGVVHSNGKSVSFTRDGEGRITAITDPLGNTIDYTYAVDTDEDVDGNLTSVTDRNNNTTELFYVADHYLERIEDPLGNTPLRNEYDASGRLVSQVDADGNRTDYDHDIENGTETITDRDGTLKVLQYTQSGDISSASIGAATSTFTYDGRGNKLTETDPNGNTITYTYNLNDQVTSETDALGNTTAIDYNPAGGPTTITDPAGNQLAMTYDANNNVLAQRDAGGALIQGFTYDSSGNPLTLQTAAGTSTMTYDSNDNVTQLVSPTGLVTEFSYDGTGRQTSSTVTRTVGGSPVSETTSLTYDANGNVLTTTDPLGNVTAHAYNGNNQKTSKTDALGRVTSYEYDSRGYLFRTTHPDTTTEVLGYDLEGRKTAHTDTGGNTTFFEYDSEDRLTRVIYPDGSAIVSTYDAGGRLLSQADAFGNATTYTYDALDRVINETDPLGNITQYTYDDRQVKPATVENARGHTTSYSYERSMWLTEYPVQTTLPDGAVMTQAFGPNSRVTTKTDPNGNITTYTYDAAGRLLTVTDALVGVTTYAYDEVGNRISQTDANLNTTTFTYDALGHMLSKTLPGGQSETWTYDAVGNMIEHTDFNGDTITHEYDARDRLIRKELPDASEETFTYTNRGKLATAVSPLGTWSFTYDARDRLLSAASPDGVTLSYTYDEVGNRTSLTSPAGEIAFTTDSLNRLIGVEDPAGDITTYTYDEVGNVTGIGYPNGTDALLEYNLRDQTIRVTHFAPDGTTKIGDFQYTLDAVGNRLQMVEDAGRTLDYTYDALNRLTRVVEDPGGAALTSSYDYDAVGNLITLDVPGTTETATYDVNSRLLEFGTRNFSYDANGNLLSITDDVDVTDVTSFEYDAHNRLIRRTEADGTISEFDYDPQGNRISRTVDPLGVGVGDAATTTGYVIDRTDPSGLPRLLLERSGATTEASYAYGMSPISMTRGSSTSFLHPDALGSTRLLTDSAGAVTDTYAYDAWGNDAGTSGATQNELRFAGERLDPSTGLYYLQARYYDPEITRFISSDPFAGDVTMPVTLQPYLYAGNNPVNMIDPTGEFSMVSISISISIVSTLASIATTAYGIYSDTKELYDKIEEFKVKIPNMRLNEESTREQLGITPESAVAALAKWDIAKLVNLGGGSVEQAFGVVYDLGSWKSKGIAWLHAWNSATWMKYLPEHENKPAHYVNCGFNEFVQKTYIIGFIGGLSGVDKIPKMDLAKDVMALYLSYFNFLILAIETANDLAGSGDLLQPVDDPSLFGPEPACPSL